ncbi:MAG TPA: carbamoyltransferase C-terminal domain-containing protein [Gemmataceae bacterium]|nr:carbamoyltransferase C-terminal domain-containing protein [Gemmataceae bacterium]
MNRNYIGLACTFHDPALAIVNARGELVFAEASERPFQTKRAFNCLPDSYSHGVPIINKYCEPDADLVIAKTWSARAERRCRVAEMVRGLLAPFISEAGPRAAKWGIYRYFLKSQSMSLSMASESLRFGDAFSRHAAANALAPQKAGHKPARRLTTTAFNHHLTHAAAACYTSPFREAVCAVVDGFGEGTTTAFYRYHEGRIDRLPQSRRSIGSLGFFYTWLCIACGFDPVKGEEWKVMGLAPYGRCNEDVYKALKKKLIVDGLSVRRGPLFDQWVPGRDLPDCGPADLACTGQLVFEETMIEMLNTLAKLGISDNLVLGGGCTLNSSCNGVILERTPFKNLHVFAAPADDGNAIGAAFLAYRHDHLDWKPRAASHTPYLGSSLSREALDNLVRFNSPQKVSHRPGEIHRVAAQALAEGRIIGWVQGRAEFGPRALGNRSILADARRPDIKDQINGRVKFREEFRPFAPSILHQHGPEYFEPYQESPYMERTLRFRPEVVDKVPGVVHVNQTGRLQSVTREMNERYYLLIEEFHRLTGIPLVLNTSFNVMGKPIIHSVEDAVAVLHTTGLDALAIEDYWVEKE